MKKVIITINGQTREFIAEDPTDHIALCVGQNVWGLPERPELDVDGNPTGNTLPAEYTIQIIDITTEVEQDRINEEALKYLADTDWMIIREIDAGVQCPADVKLARAEARTKIVRNV